MGSEFFTDDSLTEQSPEIASQPVCQCGRILELPSYHRDARGRFAGIVGAGRAMPLRQRRARCQVAPIHDEDLRWSV